MNQCCFAGLRYVFTLAALLLLPAGKTFAIDEFQLFASSTYFNLTDELETPDFGLQGFGFGLPLEHSGYLALAGVGFWGATNDPGDPVDQTELLGVFSSHLSRIGSESSQQTFSAGAHLPPIHVFNVPNIEPIADVEFDFRIEHEPGFTVIKVPEFNNDGDSLSFVWLLTSVRDGFFADNTQQGLKLRVYSELDFAPVRFNEFVGPCVNEFSVIGCNLVFSDTYTGAINTDFLSVGRDRDGVRGEGQVTVGENGVLNVHPHGIEVGFDSPGQLIVEHGGSVSTRGFIGVGSHNGGLSELIVRNEGYLTGNSLSVGQGSSTEVNKAVIESGGVFETDEFIWVGVSSKGHLTVRDGGRINGVRMTLGTDFGNGPAPSKGTAEVTGANSILVLDGQTVNDGFSANLTVGDSADGSFTLSEDAFAQVSAFTAGIEMAQRVDVAATMSVRNADLLVRGGHAGFWIGRAGDARFSVRDGGSATVDSSDADGVAVIAEHVLSSSDVIVDGPSSLLSLLNTGLTVGGRGRGGLEITNRGRVEILPSAQDTVGHSLTIGGGHELGGGAGTVTVSGRGGFKDSEPSLLRVQGDGARIIIGHTTEAGGTGTLTVEDGGVAELSGGPATFELIEIAPVEGATGLLEIDGNFSRVDAGDALIVSTNPTLGEFAVFGTDGFDGSDDIPDVSAGNGTVIVSNGGRLETDFGTFIGNGGALLGNGTVVGSLFAATGATVSPGLSPGDLTVIGDFDLSAGGTLVLEIFDLAVFDRVLATGQFRLDGGEIEFSFEAGVNPEVLNQFDMGDFFRTLEAEGAVDSPVSISDLTGLAGVSFSLTSTTHVIQSFQLSPDGTFNVSAAAVPLPAPLWLLTVACWMLVPSSRKSPGN